MRVVLLAFLVLTSHLVRAQLDSTRVLIIRVNPIEQKEHRPGRQPIWILNGIDTVGGMNHINPKNIDKIEVVKTTEPPEIRVTTKKGVVFADYQYLKDRLNVSKDEHPDVLVDDVEYQNELDIVIDKSCIKKLKLIKRDSAAAISLTTIYYKKNQKRKKRPEIYIRGATTAYNKVYASCRALALEINN